MKNIEKNRLITLVIVFFSIIGVLIGILIAFLVSSIK